jgi:RNA polymerase sigma factor (sigma-70 family)
MMVQPESDEALVNRLLPSRNPDAADRASAWAEWHQRLGDPAVRKYVRLANNTAEPDEDILQDAMLTAYVEVERGRYQQQAGIPLTAYVKGIARNKIREARRRARRWEPLESLAYARLEGPARELENACERRQQQRALRAGLEQLPPTRRQVLEHYLNGESLGEIAARLHLAEATVRQHKHRGLRRLQAMNLPG